MKTSAVYDMDPTMKLSFSPGSVLTASIPSAQTSTFMSPPPRYTYSTVTPRSSTARVRCRATPATPHITAGKYGSLVVVNKQGHDDEALPLNFDDKPVYFMGRREDCDICIRVAYVSRQHARLVMEDGSVWLTPLSKNQHTFLNDEPLTESTELINGDVITVGGREFKYVGEDDMDDESTPNAFHVDRDDDPTMTNLADFPAQLDFNEPAVSVHHPQKSVDLIYPSLDDITLENVYPQKYSSARNNEMASVVRSPLANVSNKNTASPVMAISARKARVEKNNIITPVKPSRRSLSVTTPVAGVKPVRNTLSTPKKTAGVTVIKKPMNPASSTKAKTPVTKQQPAQQSTLVKSPGVKTRRVSAAMNSRPTPSTPKQNPGPAAPSTPRRSISKGSPRSSGSFPNYMPTPLRKQSAVRKMRASTDAEPPKIPTSTRPSMLSTPVKSTTTTTTPSRTAPRSLLKSASKTKPSKMRKSLSRKSVSFSHNLEINCFFSSKETTEEIREQRSKLEHLLSPIRPPNSPGVLKRRSNGHMNVAVEGKDPVARKLVFPTATTKSAQVEKADAQKRSSNIHLTPSAPVTGEKSSTPKNRGRPSLSHKRRRSVCSNESLSPSSSPMPEVRQAKRRKLLSTPEPSTPTNRRRSSYNAAKSPSLLTSDLMLSPFSPRRNETTEMSVSKQVVAPNPFQSDRFNMSALPDFSAKLRTSGANPFKPVYNPSDSSATAMEQDDEFEFSDEATQPKKTVAPIVYVPPEEKSEKTQNSVEKEEPKKSDPVPSARPVRSSTRVRERRGVTRQTFSSAQKQRQQQVKEQEQPKETKVESTAEPKPEAASITTTRVRRRAASSRLAKKATVNTVETETKSAEPVVQEKVAVPQEPEKPQSPKLPNGVTIDTLDKLRVVDLRPLLQERGLTTSGLKKDLVNRLKIALMQEITPETNTNEQTSASDTDPKKQEAEDTAVEPTKTTTRRRRQTVQPPASSRPKRSAAARRRR